MKDNIEIKVARGDAHVELVGGECPYLWIGLDSGLFIDTIDTAELTRLRDEITKALRSSRRRVIAA